MIDKQVGEKRKRSEPMRKREREKKKKKRKGDHTPVMKCIKFKSYIIKNIIFHYT